MKLFVRYKEKTRQKRNLKKKKKPRYLMFLFVLKYALLQESTVTRGLS